MILAHPWFGVNLEQFLRDSPQNEPLSEHSADGASTPCHVKVHILSTTRLCVTVSFATPRLIGKVAKRRLKYIVWRLQSSMF